MSRVVDVRGGKVDPHRQVQREHEMIREQKETNRLLAEQANLQASLLREQQETNRLLRAGMSGGLGPTLPYGSV